MANIKKQIYLDHCINVEAYNFWLGVSFYNNCMDDFACVVLITEVAVILGFHYFLNWNKMNITWEILTENL
jgi:ABC-type Fe3+-siderophore transport system permease subunit